MLLRKICYARCGVPRGLLGEPGRAGIIVMGGPVRSGLASRKWDGGDRHRDIIAPRGTR
jgi:hypothetical protein